MEIAFGHFSSVRCAVPRKDSLHLTARKTGIHNMAKSGGRKRRPQGCSLRSHRLRRLKPLPPTLSPATHSAMPSMLPCCTSDLKRRQVSSIYRRQPRIQPPIMSTQKAIITKGKSHEYSMDGHLLI